MASLRETKLQEEVRKKSGRRGVGLEVEWSASWAEGWVLELEEAADERNS